MKAIDHLNRYVSNVDKFIDFYRDVLDYKLIDKGIKGNVDQGQEIIVKPFSRQFYIKDPDNFEIDLIQWIDKNKFYHYLKGKNIK